MKSVTIVIPIFDETADFILQSVFAAKLQSYSNTNVFVISKNGSKIHNSFSKVDKIQCFSIEDSGMLTLVDMLNLAIKENKNDYINFIPQSSAINLIKTEYQIQHFEANSNFKITATGGITVRKRLGKILSIDEKISNEFNIITGLELSSVLRKSIDKISYHYPITAGLMYDKWLFQEYGLFNTKFPLLFEVEFLLRVLKDHDVKYVGNMLYTDINDEMTYQNYFDYGLYTEELTREKKMLLQ